MGRGRKRPPGVPGGAEPGSPGEPGGVRPGTPGGGGSGSGPRRFTEAEQRAFLEELEGSGESVQAFARRIGVTVWTVYWWRKAARRLSAAKAPAGSGSAALEARPGKQAKRPAAGERRVPSYGPDARREAVEAYRKSGLSQQDFGKLWGVSAASIGKWSRAYETGGPKALEEKARGRPKGSGGMFPRLPQAVREAIVATKRRFPTFGLRKVRDFLLRFQGIRVSAGGVRSTLVAASGAASGEGGDPLVGPSKPSRPVRKRKPMVRRFERARAGQLWQTDITSFVLARHHVRVYLVAFIDDHSRYVVSFGLHTHQKNEMVQEALLEGIEKFGKPEEVLSDQGPQYFSWRGKSSFRRLLDRKGIKHVVARSRQSRPMTVGKCGRVVETVKVEFWERCQPQDLSEAGERMGHCVASSIGFGRAGASAGWSRADRVLRGLGAPAADDRGGSHEARACARAGRAAADAGLPLRADRGPAGVAARGEGEARDPDAGRSPEGDGAVGARSLRGPRMCSGTEGEDDPWERRQRTTPYRRRRARWRRQGRRSFRSPRRSRR